MSNLKQGIFIVAFLCYFTDTVSANFFIDTENPYRVALQMKFLLPQDSLQLVLKKKVSLHITQQTLGRVIEALQTAHGLEFIYIAEQIPWNKRLSVEASGEALSTVLQRISANAGIGYFIIDGQIALTSKGLADTLEFASSNAATALSVPPERRQHEYKQIIFKTTAKKHKFSRHTVYYVRTKKKYWAIDRQPWPSLPSANDSVYNDSLKKAMQKKDFSLAAPTNGWYWGFSLGGGNATWRLSATSPTIDRSLNNYKISRAGSINFLIIRIMHSMVFISGLTLERIQKTGSETAIKVNRLYPALKTISQENYRYFFSYFSVPLGAGYFLRQKKWYWTVGGFLQPKVLIKSNTDRYPTLTTQYFVSLNPLSKGTPPYYNQENQQIITRPPEIRTFNLSTSLFVECNYKLGKNNSIFISPAYHIILFSVYKQPALVKESPSVFEFRFGYRGMFH